MKTAKELIDEKVLEEKEISPAMKKEIDKISKAISKNSPLYKAASPKLRAVWDKLWNGFEDLLDDLDYELRK